MPTNVRCKSACRQAVAVIEVLAAIAILSVVLILAAKMTTQLNQHRKAVERHRITLDAKTNLMSFAMALPYDDLSEAALRSQAKQLFADAEWRIEVSDTVEGNTPNESGLELPAKKVVVDLLVDEAAQSGKLRQPLILWRYSLGGEQ